MNMNQNNLITDLRINPKVRFTPGLMPIPTLACHD